MKKDKLGKLIAQKFNGWDVATLSDYVDEQSPDIIPTLVKNTRTAEMITIQEGIKDSWKIKLLNTTLTPQVGGDCGRNPLGGAEFTDKTLTVDEIKYNMDFCNKDLIGHWTQLGLKAGTMIEGETLPYEDQIIAHFVKQVQNINENLLWQGDKNSSNPLLNKTDGFIKRMKADGVTNVNTGGITAYTTSNITGILFDVRNALSTEVLSGDHKIFVGFEVFDLYCQAQTVGNLFHFNPENNRLQVRLHGTNSMIEAVPGLDGTNEIYAGTNSLMFMGTDLESDMDDFSIFYSKESGGKIYVDIEYRLGTQFVYPTQFKRFELAAS
jgi:hypothetical protein